MSDLTRRVAVLVWVLPLIALAIAPSFAAPSCCFTTTVTPCAGGGIITADASCSTGVNGSRASWDLDNDGRYDDATGLRVSTGCLAPGSHMVRLRVCGFFSQCSTCSRTVVVPPSDEIPPVITECAEDRTLYVDEEGCSATIPALCSEVTATDNVTPSGQLVCTQDPAAGTQVGLGEHTVTIRVCDAMGNCSTCEATMTVVDDTAPVITCTDQTVAVGDLEPTGMTRIDVCSAPCPVVAEASDNCDEEVTIEQSPAPGTPLGLGQHMVMAIATDDSGNSASCSAIVTVVDLTPPEILNCPMEPVSLCGIPGEPVALPDFCEEEQAVDNCSSMEEMTCGQTPEPGTLISEPTWVTVWVCDASENCSYCQFWVYPYDTTPPMIELCDGDGLKVANGDGDGEVITVAAGGDCTAECPPICVWTSDDCPGAVTVTQDPPTGMPLELGETVVTVTATDNAGNSSSLTVTVNVVDMTPPWVECPGDFEIWLESGCSITLPDFTWDLWWGDNCELLPGLMDLGCPSITQDPPAGTVLGAGSHSITLTVCDCAGNCSSCQFWVTVHPNGDETAPYVELVSPFSGERLSGTATLEAWVCDNESPVTQVEFLIDGHSVAVVPVSPAQNCGGEEGDQLVTSEVDISHFLNRDHVILARATNDCGLTSEDGEAVIFTNPAPEGAPVLTSSVSRIGWVEDTLQFKLKVCNTGGAAQGVEIDNLSLMGIECDDGGDTVLIAAEPCKGEFPVSLGDLGTGSCASACFEAVIPWAVCRIPRYFFHGQFTLGEETWFF